MHVWLQLEFPWIGYGFIPAVTETHADKFENELRKLGFNVAAIQARTRQELFDGIRIRLHLADYCQPGWDSLHDCLRDFDWPPRFALVLREADQLAAANPKLFGEACAFLTREFNERDSEQQQSCLVVTGTGPTFHDPEHPSPDRALDEPRNMPVAIARRERQQAH
jgi:hypothetical protein